MLEKPNNQESPNNEALESWKVALKRFAEETYPVFEPYGFSISEAFLVYRMNLMQNAIEDMAYGNDDDESEKWKH